jgi:hypothetical protein
MPKNTGSAPNGIKKTTQKQNKESKSRVVVVVINARILVIINTSSRLNRSKIFAVRQAFCASIKSLIIARIPKVQAIKTG